LNKEELCDRWKEYIIAPIYKKDNETDCTIYHGISPPSLSCKILSNILLSRLSPCIYESVGFKLADRLPIQLFAFIGCLKRKWEQSETVHELFTDFKKVYVLVRSRYCKLFS
jgi:hypothetical protein